MNRVIDGKGYRYISDIPEIKKNGLPKGILNKKRADVGGTFSVLSCSRNYIVIVPYISLIRSILNDKNLKKPMLGITGDTKPEDFGIYLENSKTRKLVVTYDSFPKLVKWLLEYDENTKDYRILIDEYHIILESFKFRYKAISKLLLTLKDFDYYTFMSATPINEVFVPKPLKKLPITTIEWGVPTKVDVKLITVKRVLETTTILVDKFKKEPGITAPDINSNSVKVEELYIFLNSVKMISSICKTLELKNNEVRVICSDTIKNREVLENIKISTVEAKNKPITFITSRANVGVNFFSNNGLVIIVSDVDKKHTLMDVETSIYQIHGRLRQNNKYNNVFRHIIFHITSTFTKKHGNLTREGAKKRMHEHLKEKLKETKRILKIYSKAVDEDKKLLLPMFKKSDSYAMYDEQKDCFKISMMLYNYELYKSNLWFNIYHEHFSIKKTYSEDLYNVECLSMLDDLTIKITQTKEKTFKYLFMKYLSLVKENKDYETIDRYEKEYPIFKKALNEIGEKTITDLKYSKTLIERHLEIYSFLTLADFFEELLCKSFMSGTFVSKKVLKSKYKDYIKNKHIKCIGISITTIKILKYTKGFYFESKQKRVNGKQVHGYIITKKDTYMAEILGINLPDQFNHSKVSLFSCDLDI